MEPVDTAEHTKEGEAKEANIQQYPSRYQCLPIHLLLQTVSLLHTYRSVPSSIAVFQAVMEPVMFDTTCHSP